MENADFYQVAIARGNNLLIQVEHQKAPNFSLTLSGFPLLRAVNLINEGDKPIGEITLNFELATQPGAPATNIQLLAPGQHEPGGTTKITEALRQKIEFSPDLAALTEATRGRVTVTATWQGEFEQPGGEVRLDIPLEFRAVNEFMNYPAVHASLATFIQPNAREVTPILRAASDLLEKHTKDGALNGYQAGPQRAHQIAGALYETLRGLRITYISPPASFENTGQKVRTTRQVVQQQFGTCIDLALLYATVLEASGLHPLIFITRSHAFAGFYASEYYGEQAVTTDPNSISNLVESNLVIPVELTGINPGSKVDFKAALKAAKQYFTINFSEVLSMTDVTRARLMAIKPMVTAQAGATKSDLESDVLNQRPFVARSSLKAITATPDEEEVVTGQLLREDPAPARFKNWKRDLLDLTLRNPLLNLPRGGTRLIELLLPSGLLAELDDALHAHKSVTLLPTDALSEVHRAKGVRSASELADSESRYLFKNFRQVFISSNTAQARRQLQRIMRDAATMSQETGSNYLYITLGHLVFNKPNGDEARAPLYLLPVKLRGGRFTPHTIKIDGEEIALPNQCLIQWLRTVRGVEFDALNRPPTDEHGIAINTALQELREQFLAQRLPFRIEESASLAILRFSTFQIWNDLNDNWEPLLENPVVNHLVHKPGETFLDPVEPVTAIPEEELLLPVAADSSQMRAITKAANGESFVLEGPPGTGKSQTITNMIAHLISAGKTVLFVAEKQAALEVVKRRLEATGIGPFALELHGKNQAMPSIREQLKNALEAGRPLDGEEIPERDWRIEHGKLAALIGQLKQYPDRIHAKNPAGESLWSAYQNLQEYQDSPQATVPLEWLIEDRDIDQVITTVIAFGQVASQESRPDHPWLLAVQAPTPQTEQQALRITQDLNAALAEANTDPAITASLAALPGPHLLPQLAHVTTGAAEGFNTAAHAQLNLAGWQQKNETAQQKLAEFFNVHRSVLASFTPEIFDSSEPSQHLAHAERVSGKLFAEFRLRHAKKFLTSHARNQESVFNQLTTVTALRDITQAQAAGAQLRDYFTSAAILSPATPWAPWHEDASAQVERSLGFLHTCAALNEVAPHALSGQLPGAASNALVQRIAQTWQAWLELLQPTPLQITQWAGSIPDGWLGAWQRDGAVWQRDLQSRNFTPWQRMARVNEQVNLIAAAGLEDFARQLLSLEISPAEAVAAFGHGLAAASFTERANAANIDYHDSEQLDRLSAGYNQQAEIIRNLLTTRLPEQIAGLRPFPPGVLRGEVAELKRQVDRKRGGYSFRELTQRYPQAILSLTPCFLMSPGSVAHFLDEASIKFDVVIFDEASQIRVPQAIGSLGRAHSAVIVGDSRQMPPTRVMEVRTSVDDAEDTGEVVVGDLESILSEAVESGLPQHWLSWHYRSKDESLITFSNEHYYDTKLITFPSPRVHDERVHLRNVGGVFDRGKTRTNRVEADAIISDIGRRLNDPLRRGESIGVVCFNIQQRDLILTLLEESEDLAIQNALKRQDGDELFVKNLENVQGDERDVILFSLAFSVDPDTGVLPLQFGPLILAGGERRLNVAITRARAEIVLFSSFKASDIDLRRTSSLGLRHLRAYMESVETRDLAMDTVDSSAQRGRVLTELAAELAERGVVVEPLLGSSRLKVDLAVRRPGTQNWQLAVLIDSPRWAALETVADRDGYPSLLSNLVDWPHVHRVWLPAWLRDRASEIDKVLAALDAAGEVREAPERGAQEPLPLIADDLISDVLVTDHFDPAQPAAPTEESPDPEPEFKVDFVPASTEPRGEQHVLNNVGAHRDEITQAIDAALETESPIALDRLIQILGRNFSYSRLGRTKRNELSAFITTKYQVTESAGSFVWAQDMSPETWQGYRVVSAASDRSITEVSQHEIINCGRRVLAQAFSVAEEDLPREIARELGYNRLTAPVAERIEDAIDIASQDGLIVLEEERFRGA